MINENSVDINMSKVIIRMSKHSQSEKGRQYGDQGDNIGGVEY